MNRLITILSAIAMAMHLSAQTDGYKKNAWKYIDSHQKQWTENVSRAHQIKSGLQGRHVSIAASHGRVFDAERNHWSWQRPELFCVTEDTYTQTVVVPFLIPMLENAGCNVITPRERDWQTDEIIVDETSAGFATLAANPQKVPYRLQAGFALHSGVYSDGENPFTAGTSRVYPVSGKRNAPELLFDPNFTSPGHYAVYVTYPRLPDALDDVRYTVVHNGTETVFRVNQQIGYGTWVYLGTFDFDPKGFNAVIVSTHSKKLGHIGVDAVRFGGGMGNIARNGKTSGLPRALEAARYTAQWYGAPKTVYDSRKSDYDDDIATRPYFANWLAGGSCFVPNEAGLNVPIELSLSVHSDAGFRKDGGHIGSLGIATTDFNNGLLDAGIPRKTSLDFASTLIDFINNDMTQSFGKWHKRTVWDKNYGETRLPKMPSAIIEMHSHQNFPEMAIAQDPVAKFTLARAMYKSILKYVADQHGQDYVVQPLAPTNFRIVTKGNGKIELSWTPVEDALEKSARPTSYNIYIRCGDGDFDNGHNTKKTSMKMKIYPGVQYDFRITACNSGGESFPTETLSAYIAPKPVGEILVVNGFQRLSAPYSIDDSQQQGFRMDVDEGVQYGKYLGWCGEQQNFNRAEMGNKLGISDNTLAGKVIAGNEFNYVSTHTRSIAATGKYTVVSCSSTALEHGLVPLKRYACIDLAFGLQKDYAYQARRYKTFTPSLRHQISDYVHRGGRLFVSGAYIGSDMQSPEEQAFTQNYLKYSYVSSDNASVRGSVTGLGREFPFHHTLNADHYAAIHPEAISPAENAMPVMLYSNGLPAAVAYRGADYGVFALGLPFECIKESADRSLLMSSVLAFLLENK